ncbi:MAG: Dyp-type peroxidase [Solirubrobacteraceae bacterium]|nr:Dyp-type peroxidase [Patulibacter sp.]
MSRLDRRRFLTRSALTLGAVGTGAAIVPGPGDADSERPGESAPATGALTDRIPFDGPKQAGILNAPQGHAVFVALDAVAPNAAALGNALQALSYRARSLATGGRTTALGVDEPTVDSGTLGDDISPDALTITIGFGASLFDDRYGLAPKKPANLTPMPRFAVDANLDPTRTHGDVLLQICAGQHDTVTHALREIMRVVRGSLELRWVINGFQSAPRGPSEKSSGRNLFAFRDGTANPDVTDAGLMDQLVWSTAGEPSWAAGGTYTVVRTIRMQVEFWDRVGLREQENMIGRHRATGAPLGGTDEFQDPRLDLDPKGERIPLDAHIRLANPRSAKTDAQRILRRGYNYDRGFDEAGALDQGLVFVAFNQDPARQFAAIQERLNDEPMTDYIRPVGGGYFFTPPGTQNARGWVGDGLFS